MKKIKIILYLLIVFFEVSCERKLTAETIIRTSLEKAHGGIENWEKLRYVFYEKTITLYDSLGMVENCKTQHIQTTLKPDFSSDMFSNEGSMQRRITLLKNRLHLRVDDEFQVDFKDLEKAKKELMGAHYVLWQPYKLLTDDVELTLEGIVQLDDGSKAYKIKAVYPDSDTIWWYYFDANTWVLRENLVKHGSNYSQIKNIEHEEHTGFRLHQKRESYTIDSIRNQKYLRACYHYIIKELR